MRGDVMPGKTAWLASSLSIATAGWMLGETQTVHAAMDLQLKTPQWDKEHVAQQVLFQYLSPIVTIAQGNLAAQKELQPLLYEVKAEDTLYSISKQYGMPFERISLFNRLPDANRLKVGQKLKLPLSKKWIRVQEGQTLKTLAEQFKTTPDVIGRLNPHVDLSVEVYVGQVLAMPIPLKVPSPPVEQKVKVAVKSKSGVQHLASKPQAAQGVISFRWPVVGQITSGYGWRNGRMHTGIDIWNEQRERCVIHSAWGGVVTRAGYANGYGNLVVIDHGSGWVTYYAHLSRITVVKGKFLETGSPLGYMGQTGHATGVHLHFEVRRGGKPINPLNVLP
jgi:murein DD-endopeptidase MepM/ murein hydrolase activator NlpD